MKDKIITLKSGKEFLVADVCTYKNIDYCFVCEVINNETTDSFGVIRIDEANGKQVIRVITDEDITKNVCRIVERHVENK